MAFRLISEQLFDNNGDPLSGGLVSVYEPGTTTEKDSYPTADDADAGTNANTNPVVLDSAGRGQIWGKSGETYKLVIQNSEEVTLETVDDISTPNNNPLKVYTAGGTADALTITLDPNPGSWSTDVSFYFRPVAANTGSATININGVGAKTLKLPDASTDLPAGYLQTSNVYGVWYDGTNAVIVNGSPQLVDTFTATATGLTTSPTGTIRYSRAGNILVLTIPGISGTSNTTSFTLTGAPSGITPTSDTQYAPARVIENGVGTLGIVRLTSAGALEFKSNGGGSGFTASGTKGVNACVVTLML